MYALPILKLVSSFFLFVLLSLPTSLLAYDYVDATGTRVFVQEPVHRIVPLYAAYTDILAELGALDCVVARTSADHTASALAVPVVGTHMRPNIERIVGLRPDLVLQLHGRADASVQTELLRGLGIPVLELSLDSFADLWQVTEILGRCLAKDAQAKALVAGWQKRLEVVTKASEQPKVFFEVRYPHLLAAGSKNIVDEIIAGAGGRNVVTTAKKLVRISDEALFSLDPDVYIVQKGPMNPNPEPPATRAGWSHLRAVQTGRVLEVDEALYSRPGPNAVSACEDLARVLRNAAVQK